MFTAPETANKTKTRDDAEAQSRGFGTQRIAEEAPLEILQLGKCLAGYSHKEAMMNPRFRAGMAGVAAVTLFFSGWALGRQANKFGEPKTIIHVSLIKWKADAPEAEKQKAMDGVRQMAAQIPGIKNIWLKPSRMQPRDYHTAFVMEFEDRAAADRYAEHPAHEAWSKHFLSIREASISPQITN